MKATINGIQIEGTPAEMVDFAEGWQTRAVGLAAFTAKMTDVQRWKCDEPTPVNDTIIETRKTAPDDLKSLSALASKCNDLNANTFVPGTFKTGHIQLTPAVVEHIDNATKRYAPVPKVKHTDAPPADAPVTKVPAGVSGKRGGRQPTTGASSHVRYAIFNGKTEQQALMKAVGGNQKNLYARISTLIMRGHIEEVNAANSIPGRRSFRITELGRTFIDRDREVLKALGKLP